MGPPRRPLVAPPPAELRRQLAELHLDDDRDPLGLTPAEKRAAAVGPPDPRYWDSTKDLKGNLDAKEKAMEVKPGWKTSEFWLKLLAGAAIALLAFTLDQGLPAIASQLSGAGVVGSILLLMVPFAKLALGWLMQRLAGKYADNRTELKVAAAAANDDAEARAA